MKLRRLAMLAMITVAGFLLFDLVVILWNHWDMVPL